MPENPWMKHVANVRQANPNLSYKEVLILAKESYQVKKQSK